MTFTEALPTVNAILNGSATLLLSFGYFFIKSGKEKSHRICMVSAFSVSVIFLFFYLLHKYLVQGGSYAAAIRGSEKHCANQSKSVVTEQSAPGDLFTRATIVFRCK